MQHYIQGSEIANPTRPSVLSGLVERLDEGK